MTSMADFTEWLSVGLLGALAFLFVLTAVVFVHELGHFLVARWCGVKVDTFSIGFGKEIWGRTDSKGTRWRLSWIPLGGYVKFMDDANAASAPSPEILSRMSPEERKGSFHAKPLPQRAAVVAAGPIANFIFSVVIFAALFMIYGVTTLEPRVGKVQAGTPAEAAGFLPDDLIVSIDGTPVSDFRDLVKIVSSSPGRELSFGVERGGGPVTIAVTPVMKEVEERIVGKHTRPVIGIEPSQDPARITHQRVGPIDALGLAAGRTWDIAANTFSYIGDVSTGRQSADQFGGPILIAQLSSRVAQISPAEVVAFTALISVSIGLVNLLPIPLLDGGHLLLYGIEAVRGRPLDERAQEFGTRVGMAIILMIFLLVTYYDLKRLITSSLG